MLVKLEEIENSTVQLTLNDPDSLNAMSLKMAEEFKGIIKELKNKKNIRAIVLTGAGRAFSAGGDLEMLLEKQKLSGEENRIRMLEFYNSFLGILNLGVPIISAINGHAVGAGLCLALASDIRIATDNSKLGVTFTKLGLHPGMGATFFLPRIVGRSIATELIITGRMILAEEALRIGLVSRVVKPEELNSVISNITKEISDCGVEATRQVLENLRGDIWQGLESALQREALSQGISYASSEFKAGLEKVMKR